MIKSKDNVCELINEMGNFSYEKDNSIVDVVLMPHQCVHIRCYEESCIKINYYDYNKGVSKLYRDRKYINKEFS
ncbi:hypothetical protein [Clostridium ihumii]|uniref:hypothetical protein n=1 Tax=Clostridium ihumii TaxID=1470356 RepID=UPI00054EC323|nr:hypothetical protein [Clostridium ihumii]